MNRIIICNNTCSLNSIQKEMPEPTITNHPTEIFGYAFTDNSPEARTALDEQFCPFLDGECKKPRKSEPHIKVGVCSAGYKGSFIEKTVPVVLCPHRFETDDVFTTLRKEYCSQWSKIRWVSEVSLGVGGNVDFVAVKYEQDTLTDFVCFEFQAAGTTGTPWQAVLDFKRHRQFIRTNYPYGINWANEFMKTMMQQVYKKGKIVAHWKRKIVFVLQDVGLEYLRTACDTSGLRPSNDADPVHFCTFRLVWKHTSWQFELAEKVSTDIEGVNKILGGALQEHYPTSEEFMATIARKLERKD